MIVKYRDQQMELSGMTIGELANLIEISNAYSNPVDVSVHTTVLICRNRGMEITAHELYSSDSIDTIWLIKTVSDWFENIANTIAAMS